MDGELAAAVARLRGIEDRLERLLASGWRNAAAEAAELTGEAEALATLGLSELAGRLRAVAAAQDAQAALRAIALAVSACRLLRAHLPADTMPPGAWTPLAAQPRRGGPGRDRLLPIARVAIDRGEAWACVRRRGTAAVEWLLVEPPGIAWPEHEPAAAHRARGFVARLIRGAPPPEAGRTRAPWLWQELQGHLRWQARYPLGATGEVEACRLLEPAWAESSADDAVQAFREATMNDALKEDMPVLSGGGRLRVKELRAPELASYVWPGAATAGVFQAATQGRPEPRWGLVWCDGSLVVPLALIELGGRGRVARIVHLTRDGPTDELLS